MKSHRGYLPRKDGDKVLWMNNLDHVVSTRGAELGLTPEESTLVITASRKISDALKKITKKEKEYNAALSYRDEVLATDGKMIGDLIATLKKRPGFNPAVGMAAGIIGSTKIQQPVEMSPQLIKVYATSTEVNVGFRKRYTDGISIYSRSAGRNKGEWEHLGYWFKSPFIDKRPALKKGVPEVRQYKARCVQKMQEIGQFSDIASVTFAGHAEASKDDTETKDE
jgi:hypothetical protein